MFITDILVRLPVDRLLGLLGSVYEDTKEDSLVFKDIATVIEPLADFVVNLTTTSECEVVSLHLVNLVSQLYPLAQCCYIC
jgi:hypothetical protein